MRAGKSLSVSSADIRRLKALVQDRNTPQKHVWRAEIVLLTAGGVGANEIMRRTAKSKTCVWRWQERFIEEGFDELLRDKTRPSRRQSGLGAFKRWGGAARPFYRGPRKSSDRTPALRIVHGVRNPCPHCTRAVAAA
jgi:Winged helix-turn helix